MNKWLSKSHIFLKRNSSTILTVAGVAGVVVTSVALIKATPKAIRMLEQAKEEKGEELTKFEIFVNAAPAYIPAMLMGTSTIACIFAANVLNKKHQAKLISAYTLLDTTYKGYKKKTIELFGEDADDAVIKEAAKDRYKEYKIDQEILEVPPDFISDEYEKELFFDQMSGRYFNSTMVDVLYAEYHFNRNFALRGYANLNEFYEFLGIPPIEAGDLLGWSFEAGQVFYGYSWVDFIHKQVVMDDGLECYIIDTPFVPTMDYENYYGDEAELN